MANRKADEKTRIPVRRPRDPTLPPRAGRPLYIEHEYEPGEAPNQIEIYFSIVQRKVHSLGAVKDRLLRRPPRPSFPRRDLHRLLAKLAARPRHLAA